MGNFAAAAAVISPSCDFSECCLEVPCLLCYLSFIFLLVVAFLSFSFVFFFTLLYGICIFLSGPLGGVFFIFMPHLRFLRDFSLGFVSL